MSVSLSAERARAAALAVLVAVPTLFTAAMLLPELTIPVPSNNDDATHFLLIQRASDALARGENVLDFWVPQVELGFPWLVYYQPLPALIVVFVHRALFGLVELLTVFNLVRYALLVLLPVTVFWSMRRMGVASAGAAVAAAISPLFSGDFRYGFEYDSYTWRGFGMFTQLAAMHLSFVTLAVFWRSLRSRAMEDVIWAAFCFAALVLTHLLYAYMMAITLGVIAVAGAVSRRDIAPRVLRLVMAALPAAAITAWLWLPLVTQTAFMAVSPYLQPEKLASYGAPTILGWLVTGDLFDHGRLPVVTALVALGIVAAALTRTPLARSALVLFLVWLVLYFGKPTLGPLVALFPLRDSLLFHRFIGSVELFAVVLVAVGAAWAFERAAALRADRGFAVAAAAAFVLLLPALGERAAFYAFNTQWMRQTMDAIDADADARTILSSLRSQPPGGRIFAGLRSTGYGPQMNFAIPFNSVRFSDLLIFNALPVVAAPYSSASLNADLIWDFSTDRPEQYQLFDIRYVVAPTSAQMPSFLRPITRTQRYTLYSAPGGGATMFGAVVDQHSVRTQQELFALNRPWFNGPDVAARFRRLDYHVASEATGGVSGGCARATSSYERVLPSRIDLLIGCPERSTLVFKLTYHPNWVVTVDGKPAATFMVSPSLLAVALDAGDHFVTAEYRSTPMKTPLALIGAALVIAGLAYVYRDQLERLRAETAAWVERGGYGRRLRTRLLQLR